ncbi:MAG: acyl-CoA dehydrogenase, partial [Deltaproteobacteria bacterium]|nr:acyl-CoA dehydrogenase [Deltaproteobacteria bacterium]
LVDTNDPGVAINRMPTIGMDNTCEVIFKDVTISKEDIIGNPGEGRQILQKMFPRAILAKCAEMMGGCKTALDMTTKYAKERVQYGQPIGGFQAIQHYMANMLLGYDTTVNYLYKTCWMADEGLDITKEVHGLKARTNEQYKFITERAVQIHGGVGTSREFDISLFYRKALTCQYVMGDTQYHYEKLAAILGT